jgi:uncharacterized protein (TIGR03435 family)
MLRRSLSFTAMSLAGIVFVIASAWAQSKDSHSTQPVKEVKFEILSIRPTTPGPSGGNFGLTPNGFVFKERIWDAINFAYVGEDTTAWINTPILNAPKWSLENTYDFNARVSQADLKAWQSQKHYELLRSALRAALQDRCKLAIHEDPVEGENWELVVGKHGPKLKPATERSTLPVGVKLLSGGVMTPFGPRGRSNWNCYGATMEDLARFLSMSSPGRPVRDKTGLTGRYDFTLELIDEPVYGSPDTLYNYPVDRLGLTLKPGKETRAKLVIDHIEKPSAN